MPEYSNYATNPWFHIISNSILKKRPTIGCSTFFNRPNFFSRTAALGQTKPLTEMSTSNLPGRKWQPTRKADNLTAICEPIAYKMWDPRRLTTL
jgi:hypothetical protein